MRKLLLVLASTATFAIINPAIAQYGATPPDPWGLSRGYPPGAPPPAPDWREQRLNAPPPPSDIAGPQQPSPNSTTGSGSIGVTNPNAVGGECAKGMSEETCRRRGQQYNPPR